MALNMIKVFCFYHATAVQLFILLLPSLLVNIAYAEPVALEDLLLKLEASHGSLKTLAVAFDQTKHFSFMDKPVVSQGFVLFESPNKIRFDIYTPFSSSMINDGEKVSRYEYVNEKWEKTNFDGGKSVKLVIDQIGNWMRGQFPKDNRIFSLAAEGDDPNLYAKLVLTPVDSRFLQHIEQIVLDIGPEPGYDIEKISIYEPRGDYFTLTMKDQLRNISLPQNCFTDPSSAQNCKKLFESKPVEELENESEK